jgi:hypothetical protein
MSVMGEISTGWKAARQATRQHRAERRTRTRSWARMLAGHGLTIAGLACFTAAAAMVAVPLGLVVAGAGFFVVEWRASE